MSIDHLTLTIQYDIKKDDFKVTGNLNEEGRREVLENFLRSQMGAGKDETPPKMQDAYRITLRWYPSNDRITADYDTGNKGLRDGILMDLLKKLSSQ